MFIQRSVIVSVKIFAKPLYTHKEKLNLKYILQYTTRHIWDLSTKKQKKSLRENLTVLKYNSRHVTCTWSNNTN